MSADNPNQDISLPAMERAFVVSSDIGLRQNIAAECLGLTLPAATIRWQEKTEAGLLQLLEGRYDGHIVSIAGTETRKAINEAVADIRADSSAKGKRSFVISMDPAFLDTDLADYTFQETRVSMVEPDNNFIDIEHNPRSHANRFVFQDGPHNGAGKPETDQMDEIGELLAVCDEPPGLTIVEDFLNTGRSLTERFGELMDSPRLETTVLAGLINNQAYRLLGGRVALRAVMQQPEEKFHHMDASDLFPTLGGRVVGWSRPTANGQRSRAVLYTIGGIARQIPIAVDALCGNYPWQADLYRCNTDPEFLRKLGSFCAKKALEFWEHLEAAAGQELTWQDIKPLTGKLRVFYPVKNLSSRHIAVKSIQDTPRRTVEAIIESK
ncbi:MAG TPA: hypothetical protein VMR45_00815 [Patescibacteria group bacterium]|nr:hypothetical protein [Patescibacteria group bacterium]